MKILHKFLLLFFMITTVVNVSSMEDISPEKASLQNFYLQLQTTTPSLTASSGKDTDFSDSDDEGDKKELNQAEPKPSKTSSTKEYPKETAPSSPKGTLLREIENKSNIESNTSVKLTRTSSEKEFHSNTPIEKSLRRSTSENSFFKKTGLDITEKSASLSDQIKSEKAAIAIQSCFRDYTGRKKAAAVAQEKLKDQTSLERKSSDTSDNQEKDASSDEEKISENPTFNEHRVLHILEMMEGMTIDRATLYAQNMQKNCESNPAACANYKEALRRIIATSEEDTQSNSSSDDTEFNTTDYEKQHAYQVAMVAKICSYFEYSSNYVTSTSLFKFISAQLGYKPSLVQTKDEIKAIIEQIKKNSKGNDRPQE